MNETNNSPLTEEEQNLLDSVLENQVIPTNSNTILLSDVTSRFSSAVWYDNIKTKRIIVAGIGGIGSFFTFLLSRVNPYDILIYDDDIIETANMSGQLFSLSDIGNHKTKTMVNTVMNYSDYYNISSISRKYTSTDSTNDIMICGFDNMAARQLFFDKWLHHVEEYDTEENKKKCLFIDGRLNAEEFQILCIRGDDTYNIERYRREFLFNDSEADETVCSYKQTTFCASMIASYMVNLFVNFCANEVGAYRDLPFYTYYNAELMYLKTEA